MLVARKFEGKFEPNSNLEIDASALYLLVGKDVPQETRQEAVERANVLIVRGWLG
jgi:hypothetical protein